MKAWRLNGKGDISLDEMNSQPVGEGCVKLKMLYSSISLTDQMLYDGRLAPKCTPLIIGRQAVGLVTETGASVTGLQRGNRVAVDPYLCCRSCAACKSGRGAECEKLLTHGVDDNGFMSDFAVVNAADAYQLPERVAASDAVFLEHIALAINTVSKLNPEKGEHIVIVGANVIGIIMAQVAMYYQAVPVLVDTRQDLLDKAAQLGVYYTVNSVDADPQKKIFSITGGRMAESVAYITTGKMSLVRSLDYAAKGGRVAIVGWTDEGSELNASFSSVFSRQLTVMGINNGAKNLSGAINMLACSAVDVKSLVSREIGFDEVKTYLDETAELPNKYLKLLVKM